MIIGYCSDDTYGSYKRNLEIKREKRRRRKKTSKTKKEKKGGGKVDSAGYRWAAANVTSKYK